MKKAPNRNPAAMASPNAPSAIWQQSWFQMLVLAGITFITWQGALKNGLTNWDDDGYLTKNELLSLPFPSLKAHFSEFVMGNYHPLTTLSLHADTLWGKDSVFSWHLTSLVLHVLNSLMVFLFFRQAPGGIRLFAFLFAALFALHPLKVESVAWVSERKDVLYSLFFLTTLWVQSLWLNKQISFRLYAGLAVPLFLLAAFSKGMAVTLGPIMFLNIWLWGRISDRKEWVIPGIIIILSLGVGAVAILAQQSSDSIKGMDQAALFLRPVYALFALAAYAGKTLLPIRLSCFYPYPPPSDWLLWLGAGLTLAGLSLVWIKRKKLPAPAWWGLLFFLISLAPVLQLLPVGEALYADRYMYLALTGLVVFGVFLVPEKWRAPGKITPLGLVLTLGFAYGTTTRIPVWKDSLTLWNNMISVYPTGYFVAYNNRAITLHDQKRYAEALTDFDQALKMFPQYQEALYNRGTSQAAMGNAEAAVRDFTASLQLKPDFYLAWYNRGNSYATLGKLEKAEADYREAVRLKPDYAEAWTNLGNIYGMTRQPEKANLAFTRAIELNKENAQAFNNRALSRVALGDTAGAREDFSSAIRLHEERGDAQAAEETRKNRELLLPGN